MAIYVGLRKMENENMNFVYYSYEYSIPFETYISKSGKERFRLKLVSGILKLHKESGDVEIIKWAEGESKAHAYRAISALMNHWKKGEYPQKTCWAS